MSIIHNAKQIQTTGYLLHGHHAPSFAHRKARVLPQSLGLFGPFPEGDKRINARTDGEHFIEAYGFNSQFRGGECWATYTYTATQKVSTSVVTDQGFRALPDDPEIALSVLEKGLPLSAVYEVEKVSVIIESQKSQNHASPTDSATYSVATGPYSGASRPVLDGVLPIQAGAVPVIAL
ncbi:hypothetical protein BBP40_005985 [Aspergillus hancockii]|nr:hypothetical protein BBP40_005985 [Aspergillus hancockii]